MNFECISCHNVCECLEAGFRPNHMPSNKIGSPLILQSDKWIFLVLLLSMVATGCRKAGGIVEDRFVAEDRFEIRVPNPELWDQQVNRRTPFRTILAYKYRKGPGELYIETKANHASYGLPTPLDIVAQGLFTYQMRLKGSHPSIDAMARLLIDDREAIAIVGSRSERPTDWKVASIYIRSQGYLLRLQLEAPAESFEELSYELERLLRHFKILLPGPFDPYVLGDLPGGAPGPSPGNDRHKSPPPKVPLYIPQESLPF